MNLKYFIVFISLAYSQQTPLIEETFEEPVCKESGECFKCSFSEMRQLDSCSKTGFKQQLFCSITSNLNNTQSLIYSSSCDPTEKSAVEEVYLAFVITCLSNFLSGYVFLKMKAAKTLEHETSISNIIKT